jgi:hypothetical protein
MSVIRRGTVRRHAAMGSVIVLILTLAATTTAAAVPMGRWADRTAGVPWRLAGPGWSVVEYSAASLRGTAMDWPAAAQYWRSWMQ